MTEIAIRDPDSPGVRPEHKHEICFTRHNGPNFSSTTVERLTDDELHELYVQVVNRLEETG